MKTFALTRRYFSSESFRTLYEKATEAFSKGNLDLAVEFNSKALQQNRSNVLDANWKDVAAVRLNQAHIMKLQADFPSALEHASIGLKALDERFTSNKLEVCHALNLVAELNCELGNFETATKEINRAIDIETSIGGVSSARLAKSYNIRGTILLNQNYISEARSDFIRALAINVHHHGKQRPLPLAVGITLSNIGNVIRKEKSCASNCVAIYREVVSSFDSELSNKENSWMFGSCLADLAQSLIDTKTTNGITEAKNLLARALHIFLSTRGISHPSTEKAASLLKSLSSLTVSEEEFVDDGNFVDTLLNECEQVLPKRQARVSGDILFIDRRGHVGKGHPHTPLF